MAYFSPMEAAAFEQQRQAVDYGYSQNITNIAARQSMLDLQRSEEERSLFEGLRRQRQQLPGAYAGRGLLRSGIYGRGLADFETNRLRAGQRLERSYLQQGQQLARELSSADINRAMALADIELQEAQRRSAISAMLQGSY
jgi:hypothetical protein